MLRRYRWTIIYLAVVVTLILMLELIDVLGGNP